MAVSANKIKDKEEAGEPVIVPEPSMEQKMNMLYRRMPSLTIDELETYQAEIKMIVTMKGLGEYFRALTEDLQKDTGIINLLKFRRKDIQG